MLHNPDSCDVPFFVKGFHFLVLGSGDPKTKNEKTLEQKRGTLQNLGCARVSERKISDLFVFFSFVVRKIFQQEKLEKSLIRNLSEA